METSGTKPLQSLAISLMAAIVLALVIRYAVVALTGTETPLVVVEGNSMYPTLVTGDIVLITKKPPEEIRVGDIIVYKSISGGSLVIHRVVKINKADGGYYYVTKGDNNLHPDWIGGLQPHRGIPYEYVVGVVVTVDLCGSDLAVRLPLIGYISLLFQKI